MIPRVSCIVGDMLDVRGVAGRGEGTLQVGVNTSAGVTLMGATYV